MSGLLLEICANSLHSALAAQAGGADRIELCESLELGGVTPSAGTLKLCRDQVHIPIHVLIRPRGGDFLYSDEEFEVMKADVIFCREIGIDGIVTGILLADGSIDKERCGILKDLAMPMSTSSHRAFDYCSDPYQGLEDLIAIGYERILTAGQRNTVTEGMTLIAELVRRAAGRIIIMPGSGVNEDNILEIIEKTGVHEIHTTARSAQESTMAFRNSQVDLSMNLNANAYSRFSTDSSKVQNLCKLLQQAP